MAAVAAVPSMGLYCRLDCDGLAYAKHVVHFPLASAAEAAGFKACAHCRPYRESQTLSWDQPELVCRGIRLILDGFLNRASEVELGARLGVSARHLRRLFVANVGVTPDGLARSARAHFARRLLDDTDLTVAEVAIAAGYGSVRQFSRASRERFGVSPTALRARRHADDRLVPEHGLLLRLPFRGPLDWAATCDLLGARAVPGVEQVHDGVYRRAVDVEGTAGVIELYAPNSRELFLRLHLAAWADLLHVVERARKVAGVDVEVDEARAVLRRDPTIGPLVRRRPGLRVPGAWDPFELGVVAILGQGIDPERARILGNRLVRAAGRPFSGAEDLGLTHLFPPPEALAGFDFDSLSGVSKRKADSLRAFTDAVADDGLRLDRSVSLDSLLASLTAIEGLNAGTAHYIALRMGEPDAFPAQVAEDAPNRRQSERWRPWRGLAATYLSLT
jgi:AraC family transcriptional regulator of adaptative response / DNA-3-methyladenine glycosylase II